MDRSTFWRFIGTIDRAALRAGDDDGAVEPLVRALAAAGEEAIRGFEDNLAEVLYEIGGRAYADRAGGAGQSGDGFLYARCYVVANGETHYHSVRVDPAKMAKSLNQACESLLYVPGRAWAAATGNDEEAWDHRTPVSYETGSNVAKWT